MPSRGSTTGHNLYLLMDTRATAAIGYSQHQGDADSTYAAKPEKKFLGGSCGRYSCILTFCLMRSIHANYNSAFCYLLCWDFAGRRVRKQRGRKRRRRQHKAMPSKPSSRLPLPRRPFVWCGHGLEESAIIVRDHGMPHPERDHSSQRRGTGGSRHICSAYFDLGEEEAGLQPVTKKLKKEPAKIESPVADDAQPSLYQQVVDFKNEMEVEIAHG
eukprot:jgi/Mesvir1/27712/Mv26219-RA.1